MQLTIKEVVAKFPPEVRDRYDFSRARYLGALSPIEQIRCPKHGEFKQYAGQLRKAGGAGCPACGAEEGGWKRRLSHDEMIAKASERHNGFYSYERTVYRNSNTKITVTCPEHGDFEVLASNHIYHGRGCPTCGAAKRGRPKGDTKPALTAAAELAQLIADTIEAKQGNKSFALFFCAGGGFPEWCAEIGGDVHKTGESSEHVGFGGTPEEAVKDLLGVVKLNLPPDSGTYA